MLKLPLKHINRQVFYISIFQQVEGSALIVSRCREENDRFTEITAQSVPPPNADCFHCETNILIFDVAMAVVDVAMDVVDVAMAIVEMQGFTIGSYFFNRLAGLYVQ